MSRVLFPAAILVLVLGMPVTVLMILEGGGEDAPIPEAEPAAAERGPVEAEVLAVVQELFDAIAHRDTAVVRRVMHPDARLVALSTGGDSVEIRVSDRSGFVASLAGTEAHFLERMWDARVRIDGPMAIVWAPYDFHVDQAFSHCGVDVFDLVRSGEEWRILSVTYTRHPPGRCGEGPA